MKIKKNLLTLACLLGCLVVFSPMASNHLLSVSYSAGSDTEVAPCADTLVWVQKTENGHTYKRLYNVTTDTWLTDWILVS